MAHLPGPRSDPNTALTGSYLKAPGYTRGYLLLIVALRPPRARFFVALASAAPSAAAFSAVMATLIKNEEIWEVGSRYFAPAAASIRFFAGFLTVPFAPPSPAAFTAALAVASAASLA